MARYHPAAALIVVDVQNDFADPNGGLVVPGADRVIPAINRETAAARAEGALVVLTQDWHPASTPHFTKDGGDWPVHCVADTWGAELHPGLEAHADTPVVRKGSNGEDGYSAFTMRDPRTGDHVPTLLTPLLESAGITDVVVIGLATDYCVKATALDAMRLGYVTTVLTDAVAACEIRHGDGEAALEDMRNAGAVVMSGRGR